MTTTTIGNAPEWSVVRLADGRVGVKGHWTRPGRAIVVVGDGEVGVELSKSDEVTILACPADTAAAWVERMGVADGAE